MSSRLLPPDQADEAAPIEWAIFSAADGEPAPAAFVPGTHSQGPAGQDAAEVLLAQQRRIQHLELELERRAREAYQQGHAAGLAAGSAEARHQAEPLMARLARSVDELASLRRRIRAEAEEDAVRLALAVARKILHREVSVDPEALLGLVKAALQRIDAREIHRLRMHPEDIPVIEGHLAGAALPSRIEVLADPSLERGGAVFETARGNLDASAATQLAEIERGFIDLVRRSRDAV
jgi:flagellar assembly protein FliH